MLVPDPEVVKLNVQAGKLDYADKFTTADLPVLKAGEAAGNYTTMLYTADLGAIVKYQFNLTVADPALRPIFNDVRFRQAMSLAVNRQEINDTIYLRPRHAAAVGRLLEVAVLRGMDGPPTSPTTTSTRPTRSSTRWG